MAPHSILAAIGLLILILSGCEKATAHGPAPTPSAGNTPASTATPTSTPATTVISAEDFHSYTPASTARSISTPATTVIFAEDFDNYTPGTSLRQAGWVAHCTSNMILSNTTDIAPPSMAISGDLSSGRGNYVCMHKLFQKPIPANRDLTLTFRISTAADMNQACVGLYTDKDPRPDPDAQGLRLWAMERTWYLQDCAFSQQGQGNNHGSEVGIHPYVEGTATATIHVNGSTGTAQAEITLPDGRTIRPPAITIDTARTGSYLGVLVYIKRLNNNHKADIDNIKVTLMRPSQITPPTTL